MVVVIRKTIKKKDIPKLLKSVKPSIPRKTFNPMDFCGKVKFNEDALLIQKRLRNEWE